MKKGFREKMLDTVGTDYEHAFWNAMRGNDGALKNSTLGEDKETGMHFLPIGSDTKYLAKLTARSAFRDIASVFDIYDSKFRFLAKDTEDIASWIPESGQIPVVDDMSGFKSVLADTKKIATIVKLENTFVRDMGFDVEEYLTDRLSKTFAIGEDAGFVEGDGEDSPFGILHSEHGAETGVETSSLTFDDINKLYFSLDPEYRENGTWMMNDETALYLRNLKDDTGNYLWRGSADTLHGKPVRISRAMPSAASGKCPVAFGDFSYYWIIVTTPLLVRVLAELYSKYDQTGYLATESINGFLIRQKAIKTIKMV